MEPTILLHTDGTVELHGIFHARDLACMVYLLQTFPTEAARLLAPGQQGRVYGMQCATCGWATVERFTQMVSANAFAKRHPHPSAEPPALTIWAH